MKYLYMVNPRIPLKLNGEIIRRSKNVELDIEDVKFALKHGPVFRKFDAQTMERVTLNNIEELHVANKGDKVEPTVEQVQSTSLDDIFEPEDEQTEDTVEDTETEAVNTEVDTVEEDVETEVETVNEDTTENVEVEDTETEAVNAEVDTVEEDVVEDEDVETEVEVDTVEEDEETEEVVAQPEQNNMAPQQNIYRKKRKNRR